MSLDGYSELSHIHMGTPSLLKILIIYHFNSMYVATYISLSSRSTVKVKDSKLRTAAENWSALPYQVSFFVCKRQKAIIQ